MRSYVWCPNLEGLLTYQRRETLGEGTQRGDRAGTRGAGLRGQPWCEGSGGTMPADALILDSTYLGFQPPHLWYFLMTALEN